MMRLSIAVLNMLLVSCQPAPQVSSPPKSATKNSATLVNTPEVQCQGKLPKVIESSLSGYRLARPTDFVEAIQKLDRQPKNTAYTYLYGNSPVTCSIFTADFNQDGLKDYAVLLINQTTNYSQFRLLINRGTTFETIRVTDYEKPPEPIKGLVYTAMFLKPSGELGAAARKYFPLEESTPERQQFVDSPTLELWNPPIVTPTAFPERLRPDFFKFDQLGNSSTLLYFFEGQLKTANVSD